ncbi:MAG: LysM peptidoglycan-binding domain-containing protein [Bacteroidales bacterium]
MLPFAASQEPVPVERSNNKVILEGKVYYIHVVKPGQTLFSIAKAYNISQKEIAIENPGVMSGLQLGQALKIPVNPSMEVGVDTSELEEAGPGENIHVVQPGETLFSISRAYGVDEESLLLANPGLDPGELREGQRIRIPATEEQETSFDEEGFVYHKVKRRETLYSIGRYYDVSVADIRNANPELGWGGPKTGQVLRIPLPQVLNQPQVYLDTVPVVDSLQGMAGDTLQEPYTYDELMFSHAEPSRRYRIAFFIPFNFRVQEPLDSLIKDVNSAARRNRIIERYTLEEKIPQSTNFLEFFQGALMAIDSMRHTGMRLDVRFYDTRRSMDRVLALLTVEQLESFDLFIGPFYPFNLELVSAFAKEHHIPVVTPFYNELDQAVDNPYLFQISPSIEEEYRQAARLVASKHRYNIVYVRDEDSLNIEKHDLFKALIFDGFDQYRPEEPVIFKEVVQHLGESDELIHSLSPDKKNLVIVPTRNEALASRVVSSLYYQSDAYDIEVLGTPYWTEFQSIDFRYYHQLNLMFYSSFWVDYTDPRQERFMTRFRTLYKNEPLETSRKGMNYGIIGHDMTLYFLRALQQEGARFVMSPPDDRDGLVQGPFRFRHVSPGGGYENKFINFYRFTPEMEIRWFEVPEYPPRGLFFRPIEDPRKRRFLYREMDLDQ